MRHASEASPTPRSGCIVEAAGALGLGARIVQTRPFASARRRTGGPGTSRAPSGTESWFARALRDLLAGIEAAIVDAAARGVEVGRLSYEWRSGSIDPDSPGRAYGPRLGSS